METYKNIEISEKNLFYSWAMALSGIIFILGIAYSISGELIYTFSMPERIILFIVTFIQFIFLCFTKKLFEFNPNTKEYRIGFKLFSFKHGEWKPFVADCSHFAFQRYEENIHYTFGGLASKYVSEEIFELRKIKTKNAFEVIISGSDIKSVIAMISLGKMLSKIYGIPFYDHVKGLAKKENRSFETEEGI